MHWLALATTAPIRALRLEAGVIPRSCLTRSQITYIFVAQKAHDLVVALGRQHAECRRHGDGLCGWVWVWEMGHVLLEQNAEWEAICN